MSIISEPRVTKSGFTKARLQAMPDGQRARVDELVDNSIEHAREHGAEAVDVELWKVHDRGRGVVLDVRVTGGSQPRAWTWTIYESGRTRA